MNAWLNYVGLGAVALSVLACGSKGSDGDDEGDENGGTSGSSTGGSSTGGSSGSATGGSSGSATGGSSGSATGGAGGAPTSMTQHGFDTDNEMWKVEYTSSATGVAVIDPTTVTLTWTDTEGDPDPGMLEGEIPYEAAGQYVGFGINYPAAVDMSRSVLTAHVRIKEGLGDLTDLMTNPGGAKLYAKSGTAYCYAAGTYTNMGDTPHPIGQWTTIRFDMTRTPDYVDPNCAVPFDPSDVLEIGIQFDTGGTSMSAIPAVVNIDTIAYELSAIDREARGGVGTSRAEW